MQTYGFFISLYINLTLKEKITIKHTKVKEKHVEVFRGRCTDVCTLKFM